MKAKITYHKTGRVQFLDITELLYTNQKIVLMHENGGFSSYFHGDNVTIEIIKVKN